VAGELGEIEIRQYRVAVQVCMVDQLRVSGLQFRSLTLSVLAMVRPEEGRRDATRGMAGKSESGR